MENIMHKTKKLFAVFCSILVFICGCNTDNAKTNDINSCNPYYTNDTFDAQKSIVSTVNENSTTGYSDTNDVNPSDSIDFTLFHIVDKYKIENDYVLLEKWNQEINELNLTADDCIGFCCIDDIILLRITNFNDDETLYSLVALGKNFFSTIDDIDSYGNPFYFITENQLYIYDYYLQNGFIHLYYTQYNLFNGIKISQYIELYDIGAADIKADGINYNCSFESFAEVSKDIQSKTDTLYKFDKIEFNVFNNIINSNEQKYTSEKELSTEK